jgi:hypothetical protein
MARKTPAPTTPRDDLRARIFSSVDFTEELVDVPSWDCKVLLRSPSLRRRMEWDHYRRTVLAGDATDTPRFQLALNVGALVMCCCVPDTGEPMFTMADIDMLAERSDKVVLGLADQCWTLIAANAEAVEAGKEISSTVPSSGTASGSLSEA